MRVVSSEFEGKSKVEQHRLVNAVIRKQISEMHGLSLHTLTPAQYKAQLSDDDDNQRCSDS